MASNLQRAYRRLRFGEPIVVVSGLPRSGTSMADLEKALTQLNDEGLSNAEMMELVDLRQVAAFQTMVNGTTSILSLTDALEDANGEAQKMADIMADTLEGDILKAKSAYEGFELSVMGGNNKISRSLRLVVQEFTSFFSILVDNMRTSEMLGADFLTQSLKNVQAMENAGKAVQKVSKDNNITLKTRAELLQEEIDKVEKTQRLQKEMLVLNEKEGKGYGVRAAAARDFAEDLTKQIDARALALNDLTEILEIEVKAEKNKNDLLELETDIRLAKEDRAKNKKDAQDKADAEKVAQEAFNNEKARIDREARELLNIHKQALVDEELTQEVYDEAAFDMEQQRLEDMKNLLIKYQEDTSVINGKILTNELKMIADKAAADAKAAQDKLDQNAQVKKDRDEQIAGIGDLGSQLTTLAGNDEKYQKVREAGIKISAAAALATNAESLALQMKSLSVDLAKGFPFNIIAVASTLALMISMKQNMAALNGGKMARGGMIEEFANGGMVNGKSHAQGGEKFAVGGRVVELEGGEAVINKRSTSMFSSQLSAMNAAGGGVKFADGGLLNQPSFSQQQFNALGQNQMMGAMGGSSKVIVVEADITSSQNAVSVIQSQATI